MLLTAHKCNDKAKELWEKIDNTANECPDKINMSSMIQVWVSDNIKLVIIVALDSIKNSMDQKPSEFETYLVDKNENKIFNDILGYKEVCRFNSEDKLFREIKRLSESELLKVTYNTNRIYNCCVIS